MGESRRKNRQEIRRKRIISLLRDGMNKSQISKSTGYGYRFVSLVVDQESDQ